MGLRKKKKKKKVSERITSFCIWTILRGHAIKIGKEQKRASTHLNDDREDLIKDKKARE